MTHAIDLLPEARPQHDEEREADPVVDRRESTTARKRGLRLTPVGYVLIWVATVALTIALQWTWMVLYLDIRYTFGSFRVGAMTGLSPTDIFVHRPMISRLAMSWLDQLTLGPTALRERLTLSIAIVAAGLAGAGLARALRHWVSPVAATCVGLATFTALAWAPGITVLQPEWTGVFCAVSGLAFGLSAANHPAGRGVRPVSWSSPCLVAAGLMLALGALQKYTTATSVVVALGVLFVIQRRRAVLVAGWTAALGLIIFALTLANPYERQWFTEMPRLDKTDHVLWATMIDSLWNLAWLNPVIMLWPAAVVLGFRLSRRKSWVFGSGLAVVVVMAGVAVQNAFYPYHYAVLPVLAAALVTLALVGWWQRTGRLPWVAVVGLVWVPLADVLARQPYAWRVAHPGSALIAVAVVTTVSLLTALTQPSQPSQESQPSQQSRPAETAQPAIWQLAITVMAAALVVTFAGWPDTPYAYDAMGLSRQSQAADRAASIAEGAQIRHAAGGARVVYLAREDAAYFVGLPTVCHYPTATFLFRSTRAADPTSLGGFQQDLACLRDPTAEFLVLTPRMMDRSRAVPIVRQTVARQFDCAHPITRTTHYVLCPRR